MVIRDVVLTILSLVWAAILLLVGGRFLALLAGANRESELVDMLYRYSDFWVKPFFGILDAGNKAIENTGGVFEPASAIAFVAYFVIGAVVLGLVRNAGGGHGLRHGYNY